MESIEVKGICDPKFERVKKAFVENFRKRGEVGASTSVVMDGRTVVNIWAGHMDFFRQKPFQGNTLVNLYSTTKAITAICLLRLVDQGKVDLDRPVTDYWPEYGAAGKEKTTVRMFLNHRAGAVAPRKRLPGWMLYDFEKMAAALAEHPPWWTPGEKHGYHALTFGWLVGKIIRNVTGKTVGQYLKDEITGPLGLDLHIGLDPRDLHRASPLILPVLPVFHADAVSFSKAIVTRPLGETAQAFTNPWSILYGVFTRQWMESEIPAANGRGTAAALAGLFGILASGGSKGNHQILSREMIAMCAREESQGLDVVIQLPTRFGLGFMLNQDHPYANFGPGKNVFAHPGAGGIFAMADPDARMGFGYVANKAGTYILIDKRAKTIVEAVYKCL